MRELGLERSLSALRQLRATHSDFAELARPFLYAHIDFRGKSLARVQLFAQHLAPCFGRYTTSICLKPVDEEAMEHITAPRARLDHLREWDRAWSSALRHLHHINCFDLTIPTLDYESLYGGTMQEILSWSQVSGTQKTGIRDMTLRSAGYGRGGFNSATDAFNARSLALLIKAFPFVALLALLLPLTSGSGRSRRCVCLASRDSTSRPSKSGLRSFPTCNETNAIQRPLPPCAPRS